MRNLRASIFGMRAVLSLIAITMTACSVRPLPQDFAHVEVPDLVRQVRCEARSAIADNVARWLRGEKEVDLAAKFPIDPRQAITFNDGMFPAKYLPIVQKFENSAIAYDFTFDMTETNNVGATFDFLGLLRHTTLSAGLSAGIDRSRQNIRTFTVTDTFGGLLNLEHPDAYCIPYVAVGNMMYPITGSVGLSDIFHNFIVLSLYSNLDGVSHKGPPAIGDTLTFTTKLSGSLSPKVTLGMASRGAQLLDATLSTENSRTDVHRLIIALALPAPASSKQSETNANFITASATTGAEAIAAQKINQIIFRFELGRASALPSNIQ